MRTVVKSVPVFALFVLFLAAADAATPKTQKTSTSITSAMMMQMPMVVPLFLEDGDFTSTLVLVNGSAVQTYADVTVRALSGKTVATSRVQFIPHSQQQVNIRKLLDSSGASGITAGSITVMQSASLNGMVIAAALSMTRLSSSPNYIDEEIAMPSTEGSQTLRAVADKGEGSPIVAITSLSDMGQHVQVQCLAKNGIRFSKAVQLSAGETLLTEACSEETLHGADFQRYAEDSRDETRGPIGIALKSDAMPGSFAAFALAPHGSRDIRYFSSVAFTDPMMVMSTTTVFTGVPVGSAVQLPSGAYTPTVALANFANQEAHITIRYAQTSGDTPNTQDVESIVVPAQSSKEVSLPSLKGDPNLQNSFLVVADGAPGDVAAKLVARSDSQLHEVELLGKDLKDPQNGGGHPWSIEGGTDSTLLLFNTTASAQHFTVMVSAGNTIWQKVYVLASMQTKAISIRDLINNRVKDDRGKMLPTDLWSGEVGWYSPGPNHGRGRILEANRNTAMARSFSCGYYSSICGGEFTPYTTNYFVGQTATFGDLEAQVCLSSWPEACSGTFLGTGNDFSYFWQSGSPDVLSISGPFGSSVDLSAASVGSSLIEGNVSDGSCGADVFQTATVSPTITFTGQSQSLNGTTQSVLVGQQIALTASYTLPSGVSVNSQSWSVPGTTIGGYTASVDSGTTSATDFTQQSTTFYWVDAASSRTITFTLNLSDGSQSSASVTFDVNGPVSAALAVTSGPLTPAIFNSASPPKVQVGNGTTIAGITFTASASSGDSGGQYSFVQIINTSAITRTDSIAGTCHETVGTGLDTVYPYGSVTATTTNDSPSTGFYATDEEIITTESFTMYLLWQPSVSQSIPVPIGYVNWQWSADVVQTSPSPPLWSMSTTTPPASSQSGFTASLIYPQWTTHGSSGFHPCT